MWSTILVHIALLSMAAFNIKYWLGQLGSAVDKAPVQESGGLEFKSHLRHLTLTNCVTLGKSLNPSCLILGHLQSS